MLRHLAVGLTLAVLPTIACAAERPVVVELFTSEGCSSCPPADAFLTDLSHRDQDVLPLAFHVTYWDRLGWRDPYSLTAATDRQAIYGRRFGDGSYVLMDNYATPKHPEVLARLADNPHWTLHFTPASCSWLNTVEGFLSKLTRKTPMRSVRYSVEDLVATIERYIAQSNDDPKPFVWTASAANIMAKLRMHHLNDSEHQAGPGRPWLRRHRANQRELYEAHSLATSQRHQHDRNRASPASRYQHQSCR